jgi:hypothetical protein
MFADLQQTKSGDVDFKLLVQMHASQDGGFNIVTALGTANKIPFFPGRGRNISSFQIVKTALAPVCVCHQTPIKFYYHIKKPLSNTYNFL